MKQKDRTKRLYFGYWAIGRDQGPAKKYILRKMYPCAHSVNELAGYVAARILDEGLADPERVYYLGKDGHPMAGYIRKD